MSSFSSHACVECGAEFKMCDCKKETLESIYEMIYDIVAGGTGDWKSISKDVFGLGVVELA